MGILVFFSEGTHHFAAKNAGKNRWKQMRQMRLKRRDGKSHLPKKPPDKQLPLNPPRNHLVLLQWLRCKTHYPTKASNIQPEKITAKFL